MKPILLCILMILTLGSAAQEAKDTLFFDNGSIIIGKIKKVKVGILTFDPDDANDITVQLRKLKTIAAVRNIYRIETINKRLYFGKLYPDTLKHSANLRGFGDSVLLGLEDISILYPFHKSIWERFDGSIGLGYSYTRSSRLGRLNADLAISYLYRKTELTLSASSIGTVTDSVFSRDRENASFKTNYYLKHNWFATVFLSYQRNLELGLLRRFQEGLGMGNKFITGKHIYTWGRGGLVFNQEHSDEGVYSGLLTEVFGQLELTIFRFAKPEINIFITQSCYYSLSQKNRFRNDGGVKIAYEVFKDFDLTLELYNNYDAKPPGEENNKYDYGFVFGFKYTF